MTNLNVRIIIMLNQIQYFLNALPDDLVCRAEARDQEEKFLILLLLQDCVRYFAFLPR
jgi:hypothetical protein